MSNTYTTNQIPSEEDEVSITGFGGFSFKNAARHCRVHHLFPPEPDENVPELWMNTMTLYLANFCEPVRNLANEIHCVACNQKLTGPYGMADWRTRQAISLDETSETLEGRCTGCGYPLRARHVIRLETGQVLVNLSGFPLMYHPKAMNGRIKLA